MGGSSVVFLFVPVHCIIYISWLPPPMTSQAAGAVEAALNVVREANAPGDEVRISDVMMIVVCFLSLTHSPQEISIRIIPRANQNDSSSPRITARGRGDRLPRT